MMPFACPSITTRSSISRRGKIFTRPASTWRISEPYAPEQELLAGLTAGVEGS